MTTRGFGPGMRASLRTSSVTYQVRQEHRAQAEIDEHAGDIGNGGQHRPGHHRRILSDAFDEERDRPADNAGDENVDAQRDPGQRAANVDSDLLGDQPYEVRSTSGGVDKIAFSV